MIIDLGNCLTDREVMRSAVSHLMALPVYKQAATIRPVTYTGIKNKNMNVGDKTYSDIMSFCLSYMFIHPQDA